MNQKKYWLKGGKVGVIIGVCLTLFFTYVIQGLNCGLSGGCSAERLFSGKLMDSFFIAVIIGFIPSFFFGAIIGWIYGKIKNRNKSEII